MKRLFALLRAVVAIGLPIAVALFAAQQLSEHDQRTRATTLARVVLDRAARTTQQLAAAFAELKDVEGTAPCSATSLATMRQIALGSSLLQAVGYVSGNELQCSSFGGGVTDLGPADYISATGQAIRQRRTFSFAGSVPLLVVTAPTGFTGFVHPSLIFEMTEGGDDMPTGIVNYSTRSLLLASQPTAIDWSKVTVPADQMDGTAVVGDQLVGWVRSPKWDQMSFAALPWAAVSDEFVMLCRYLVPLGLICGALAFWLMRKLEEGRSSLPALLRAGLRRNEILLVYQPIVDLRTGHWVGAEVLSRWRRRSGEWVSPDVFIPIAEKHGLIAQLTQFVVGQALAEMGAFIHRHPEFFLSLNISSSDLSDPGFRPRLIAGCSEAQVPCASVHLEITERQEVDQSVEAGAIAELRRAGFKVGTDDFGVGYSNLAYLENFELDYLKIDRVFVANGFRAAGGAEMIDHIIDVGKARHLEIIAEGIERPEQLAHLLTRGVVLGQGWLFSRELPPAEFLRQYRAPDDVQWLADAGREGGSGSRSAA